MSHELRTPLTAIMGYEELIADGISGPVNDAQRQQLGRIKASATHLLMLIDEILLFAHIDGGQAQVRVEVVPVKALVRSVMEVVAGTAHDRGLTLTADPIDPTLVLHTDVDKLRQVLVSLLTNAVKFTSQGGVTIGATGDDGRVVFEVRDTGRGIDEASFAHLFDPFWQVDPVWTRQVGGSGLGLAVTRRLTDLLGGDIAVASTLGEGSTFRVTLPKEPPIPPRSGQAP
jgi:signal transduction histidine kinase